MNAQAVRGGHALKVEAVESLVPTVEVWRKLNVAERTSPIVGQMLSAWSPVDQVHRIISQRMMYLVEDTIAHENMGDYAKEFKKIGPPLHE